MNASFYDIFSSSSTATCYPINYSTKGFLTLPVKENSKKIYKNESILLKKKEEELIYFDPKEIVL